MSAAPIASAFVDFCKSVVQVSAAGDGSSAPALADLALDTLLLWCSNALEAQDVDEEVFGNATKALWMLSLNEALAHRIVAQDGLQSLCRLCSRPQLPDDAVESTVLTLTNIACLREDYRHLVVNHGGLEAVLRLCEERSDKLVKAACGALFVLCLHEENQARFVELGGLETVIAHCRRTRNDDIVVSCVGILRVLTMNDHTKERHAVAEMGGVQPLVRLCRKGQGSNELLEQAAATLANMAEDAEIRFEIAQADGLQALLTLLQPVASDPPAATLSTLSHINPAGRRRAKVPGPRSGSSKSEGGGTSLRPPTVLSAVANAIAVIALNNEENQLSVASLGGLEALHAVADACTNPEVLLHVMSAFESLVDDCHDVQDQFMEIRGFELLLETLARSADPRVQSQVCRVSRHLMNGKHDVVSPTERIRFDLQGTLRHLITSGEAVVKQEASQTLRAYEKAAAANLKTQNQRQRARLDELSIF